MQKLILISILLVFVYQFDDVMRALHAVYLRIRHKRYKQLILDSDHYVGTALTIIGMPLALNYLLVSEQSLNRKLMVIAGLYLLFTILASGIGVFMKRLKHLSHYNDVNAVAGAAYAIAGLFHPVMRTVPWHFGRERKMFARLALLLSLPAIAGLIFRAYYDNQNFEAEFMRHIDTLIVVMVGGVFINITVRFLHKYLRHSRMPMFGYVRILVGIGVSAALIMQVR